LILTVLTTRRISLLG